MLLFSRVYHVGALHRTYAAGEVIVDTLKNDCNEMLTRKHAPAWAMSLVAIAMILAFIACCTAFLTGLWTIGTWLFK